MYSIEVTSHRTHNTTPTPTHPYNNCIMSSLYYWCCPSTNFLPISVAARLVLPNRSCCLGVGVVSSCRRGALCKQDLREEHLVQQASMGIDRDGLRLGVGALRHAFNGKYKFHLSLTHTPHKFSLSWGVWSLVLMMSLWCYALVALVGFDPSPLASRGKDQCLVYEFHVFDRSYFSPNTQHYTNPHTSI